VFLIIQARISDAFISGFLGHFLFEYVEYVHSYVLNVGQRTNAFLHLKILDLVEKELCTV